MGFGLPGWMLVEVLAEGVVAGESAVEFAFEGVSSDMGSGELCVLDAVGADVGFRIPDVDDGGGEVGLLVSVEPGVVVADAAAGGVDEEGAGF